MRVSFRSKIAAYVLAILGVTAVTTTCVLLRAHVNTTTAALAFVLVVLFSALAWGSLPALVASVFAMLCFNFFFLPPIGTLTIADPENWIALGAFFITAVAGGQLSARLTQQTADAKMLARLQAVVADLGQRALRLDSNSNLLDEAARLVATTLDVDYTNVAELLPDGTFLLRAGVGWKEGQIGRTIGGGAETQPGFTVGSDRVVVVKNAAMESRFHPVALTLGEKVSSTMSVMIPTTQGPYGTFGAHTRAPRAFTADEVNFLQSVANVLGAALERQRDDDALRESETSLNRAQEVAHLGSWHLDIPHDRLTWSEEVFRIFAVSRETPLTYQSFLELIHPEDRKHVEDAWSAAMRGAPYDIEHRIIVTNGEIRWVRERAQVTFDEKGVAVGGVGTVQDVTERRLASRTAELEASRKRESAIGSRIQQMLLMDRPPIDVPGLHVAALSIPSQQIDGDFYDFYQHEDQCVDVIVADVMEKGIPAALLGAATKSHVIEALCHLLGTARRGVLPQPREIVTQAHTEMVKHLIELESFVTLCYARFDLPKRTVTLVDCGHTGLLHWHAATGACEIVHGNNVPLGIRENELFDQIEIALDPDDVMLLFSDGVTDARDGNGDRFGEDRLVRCVQANSGLEPRELVEAVRKAALDFAASPLLKDDLTCLAIRIAPNELPLARSVVELRSDLRELAHARQFVRDVCGRRGASLDDDGVRELELAVTEAYSNIVKHAYHGRDDQWIRLEGGAYPDSVSLQLHYLGDPFDPSSVSPPPFDGTRDSGFGIYLIGKSVDDVRYFRDERGRNCVALVKKRNETRKRSWIS